MANLKIGFIGCGGIANQKHFPGMAGMEGVDMVAFCDLIIERAEKAAKEYGTSDAKVYTDYKELLADPTIDAVHVLTPNISTVISSRIRSRRRSSMTAGWATSTTRRPPICAAAASRHGASSRTSPSRAAVR